MALPNEPGRFLFRLLPSTTSHAVGRSLIGHDAATTRNDAQSATVLLACDLSILIKIIIVRLIKQMCNSCYCRYLR